MPIKRYRKVYRTGQVSLNVTLPRGWCIWNGIQKGDTVEVISNGDVIIRALPHRSKR